MTGETFRCFVAVPVSEEAKSLISSFTSQVRNDLPDYRFGAAENLHITLQFLGDVPRSVIPALTESLARAADGVGAFRIGCDQAGAFPERGAPRILHLTVTEGTDRLVNLATRVRQNLNSLGFTDPKPFAPHITLGRERGRNHAGIPNIRSHWKDSYMCFLEDSKRKAQWEAGEILLMESVLRREGPTYIHVSRVKLA